MLRAAELQPADATRVDRIRLDHRDHALHPCAKVQGTG